MDLSRSLAVLLAAHARCGETPPVFGEVEPGGLPAAWAGLLAAPGMTAALAERYGAPVRLALIGDDILLPDRSLDRAVILSAGDPERPAALAGLRIHLEAFEPRLRVRFVESATPFGAVLREEGVPFVSTPVRFLRCRAGGLTARLLRVAEGTDLYGRQGRITGADGRLLAEVVELLTPPPEAPRGQG